LSRALSSSFSSVVAMHKKCTFLLVTLPYIHRLKNENFTDRLSNKPLLIWLLTIPPHLKYVATLPCNLLIIAFYITVPQGSVASYARYGGIFNSHFTANLLQNTSEKFLKNSQDLTELWP